MEKIFVDTNIWLRYFLQDHEPHNEKSKKIIKGLEEGKYQGLTSALVIAEVIWTLDSFYEASKEEIVDRIESILSTPNLEIKNKSHLQRAIKLFSISKAEFIDCYNYVLSNYEGVQKVASFDDDWDQFENTERITK